MAPRTPTDDKSLGMGRKIHRRDFLNGAAVAITAIVAARGSRAFAQTSATWPQDVLGYNPAALTGLRGSHPGSYEAGHALRDHALAPSPTLADPDGPYDLIVVGAGISGLSAAHFFRVARPSARILILDNHDDFGGHAKRNEFRLAGKLHLMNGGTLEIDSPRPYSAVADGLLKTLGVDPPALSAACDHEEVYAALGLGSGAFFDKETFGEDRLVGGLPPRRGASTETWSAFAANTPLSATARNDLVRINTDPDDPLAGLTSAQKKDRLSRISYREYLKSILGANPQILSFYQTATQGEWGVGIDAVSALDCWGYGLPGFQGLSLDKGSAPRMGPTPAGYADGGSYTFHFPDGNATIARLLVRSLLPDAVPGTTCDDVLTATVDYAALDRQGGAVRVRLASTAVRVRNLEGPSQTSSPSRTVEVAYVRGGTTYTARASACVLASWNMMIPYLCPELPDEQKVALHALVKTPLVYTSVAIRNWTAFAALGVRSVSAPNGYHTSLRLNPPVDIGGISAERAPERPALVHMVRTPCRPGIPEHDQNRIGRAELLATSFETFEREIRSQLGRTLGAGGFDPARDISAITVNRWPHGYAPEYNPLWDPELAPELQPHVLGRARFGRIAIANSDAGGAAYTDVAIDQGYRAVSELLGL